VSKIRSSLEFAAEENLRTATLVDELRAELVADPPCQPTLARATFRHDDGELGRNIEMLGDDLHASIRYVGDRAITRQRPGSELDFRETPAQAALASASIH
jgi:hypothetical protein